MLLQKLPPIQNVTANGVATLFVPIKATINRIVLTLGGTTFTKAMITDIKVKLGAKIVYNLSGAQLDLINQYRGIYNDATHLTIDFTERDAPSVDAKEVGAYDLGAIRDDMYMEFTIAGATAPTLVALAFVTPTQGNPLILKMLSVPANTAVGGKFNINFNPRGALVKRVHMFSALITQCEVKKNGIPVFDSVLVADNSFIQQEYRKVPQAGLYVVDFVLDNNQSGALVTGDAQALEWNPTLSGSSAVPTFFECYDLPGNL